MASKDLEVQQLLKGYRKGLISEELFAQQMDELCNARNGQSAAPNGQSAAPTNGPTRAAAFPPPRRESSGPSGPPSFPRVERFSPARGQWPR